MFLLIKENVLCSKQIQVNTNKNLDFIYLFIKKKGSVRKV